MKLVSTIALVAFACTVPATAQLVQTESLTNWTHAGGPPEWTDDVLHTGSAHGIVDQLNSTSLLQYTGSSINLQPGTYVAAARLMKFQDQTGVADIELLALASSGASTATLLAANQPTDAWVRTPYVTFTLLSAGSVAFVLQNADVNVTKQNYYFDEITIGEVDLGPTVHYMPMTQWGHAWGGDPRYYAGETPDAGSAAGFCEQLISVWWLEFLPQPVALPPGLYSATVRLKKTVSASSRVPVDLEVQLPSGNSRVTLADVDQVVDQFVHTPDVVFTVGPNETPSFWFGNVASTFKANYMFDALIIRRGAYREYGSGCASSVGPVGLRASTPVIGGLFTATVRNVAPLGGVLGFGGQRLNLDLTSIGMPNCWLLASLDTTLPLIPDPSGVARVSLVIPNNPALAGGLFYNQAVVFDPAINAVNLVTSNGGFAEFSF